MKTDQTRLRNEIKSFFHYNIVKRYLSIDWDSMCIHILNKYKRSFSPIELERASIPELKKLEGMDVNEGMFNEIARFFDEMSMYLHVKGMTKVEERNEKRTERFLKYQEDLQKSQRDKKR